MGLSSTRDDIQVGARIEWDSQAGGSARRKSGLVHGLLPAGDSLHALIRSVLMKRGTPQMPVLRHVKAQDRSQMDRCLVEVLPEAGGGPFWYAPQLNHLEKKARILSSPSRKKHDEEE